MALEFASRFGRSAPAWFSTPDLLVRQRNEPAKSGNKSVAGANARLWHCPVILEAAALAELKSLIQRNNAAVLLQLDWQAIKEIAPEAQDGLGQVFAYLCSAPLQLVFSGHDMLERVLRSVRELSPVVSSWVVIALTEPSGCSLKRTTTLPVRSSE